MRRRWLVGLALGAVAGCTTMDVVCTSVILPEQRTVAYRDPARLPPAPIPPSVPPRTVSDPRPTTPEWPLSLDEAIRIALEHARVVRVLAGISATSSGSTIYDAAITNATIDQAQAAFDPNFSQQNTWTRTNTPFGSLINPFDPTQVGFSSTPTDSYQSMLGLTKTNVLGGQWALNWLENPTRVTTPGISPLNPQNPNSVSLSYTQPLLQNAGFRVNLAPIVIARINTEVSFFQYKDSVQELVRGVIEAYWTLVQARTDLWARQIQVDQSKEAFERTKARFDKGMDDGGLVAQSRVTYMQFRANLVAAEANVLAREGAIRNLLGLPVDDDRKIVPYSAPTTQRLKPDWDELIHLAEQRRPDIVELKLITEADQQRLIQAENQTLPRLDAVALYRWNGLDGRAPNGEWLNTPDGRYTDWSVGVNFSVPLGLRAGRAQVRQQSLVIARDRANVEQGVHNAVHEVGTTVRELDNSYEQYVAFKDARAAAYFNLNVQLENYKKGRTIYLTVLQALNDFGNSVSSEAQALINYNIALARLERQTGTILETHGLVFQEERYRSAGPIGIPSHRQLYPSATFVAGEPQRYPATDKPGENAFDLRRPEIRKDDPRLPMPAPVELGKPRPVVP